MATMAESPVCLQCGTRSAGAAGRFCRRCGLPFGRPPREEVELISCPVCYRSVDDDGRIQSAADPRRRLDMVAHLAEHEQFPVGDDELLERMREGDRIRIERWTAPYDLVRRYLVTGAIEGGRQRAYAHNAIVMAMLQVRRWGSHVPTDEDRPEWGEARGAVSRLIERYHTRRPGSAR